VRALVPALVLFAACGPLTPPTVTRPDNLVCDRVIIPSHSLEETLGLAVAGDCVIVPSGTYTGEFVLPEDVSLAASAGASVTLTGGDPVLTVRGGDRSQVQGVRIVATGGGIAIDPGPARLVGVKVTQAARNAIISSCTRDDCAQREVSFTDCELTQNAVGLRVKGAHVRVEGGRIAEQTGTSLSSGSGVVASAGASVTLRSVNVETNANVGVLLDGAQTRAAIDSCTVRGNAGRGIWAQGQAADAGVATISINGGEVSGNALVGIGARDASGLVVKGVLVKETTAVRVPIDISRFEDVGDGIGLFSGTTHATVESVTLQGNARAQLLADSVGVSVKVQGASLSGGTFRAIVQRTAQPIELDPQLVDDAGVVLTVQSTQVELLP
jgi:hypothetical protein